jgi:hypothetical protein
MTDKVDVIRQGHFSHFFTVLQKLKISIWFPFTEINHDIDGFWKSKEGSTVSVALKNHTNFLANAIW